MSFNLVSFTRGLDKVFHVELFVIVTHSYCVLYVGIECVLSVFFSSSSSGGSNRLSSFFFLNRVCFRYVVRVKESILLDGLGRYVDLFSVLS